jgi:hypothetical protein
MTLANQYERNSATTSAAKYETKSKTELLSPREDAFMRAWWRVDSKIKLLNNNN